MEISEAISVPPNLDSNSKNHHIDEQHSHSELGFLPSSPDPDPAPSDLDHALLDELQKLDLKEKEEEDEGDLDGFQELGLKEKEESEGEEEEVEKKSSNGGATEIENESESENERLSEQSDGGENKSEDGGGGGGGEEEEKIGEESSRRYQYPVRPEAEDCSYYLKTGSCKYGFICKFNHPVRRKTNQKDKVNVREELGDDKSGQIECKYYLRSGGCKYGKACRYSHSKGKPFVAPVLELNFLGLPIRPGERECPYYMRNGSCKYASNCRFNHPDPIAAGGSDPKPGFGNSGPASLQAGPQSTVAPWSAPRSLNETSVYVPMMMPPSQGIPSHNTEWNGYQAPGYLSERSMPAPLPYVMNNSVTETNIYKQYPQQKQAEEFPERPGQPFCSYFLRTGDCKFKSNCKYHHPKIQTAVLPPSCALSDMGLPLRPDQNICTHYSRYGICKFGPSCKFDHPLNLRSSTTSGADHQLPFSDLATTNGAGTAGSRSFTDSTSQPQPV